MISLMLQGQFKEELIIGITLLNPLQVFRTGALILFDPQLTVIGPAANIIVDTLTIKGFLYYAVAYPLGLGWLFSLMGYATFRKGDLI